MKILSNTLGIDVILEPIFIENAHQDILIVLSIFHQSNHRRLKNDIFDNII